jgi:hypothetical protein
MRVELFLRLKIDPQGGLLNGLKKWLILGVIFGAKNRLFLGFKME